MLYSRFPDKFLVELFGVWEVCQAVLFRRYPF
jgi:hypothetical protein